MRTGCAKGHVVTWPVTVRLRTNHETRGDEAVWKTVSTSLGSGRRRDESVSLPGYGQETQSFAEAMLNEIAKVQRTPSLAIVHVTASHVLVLFFFFNFSSTQPANDRTKRTNQQTK